MPVSSCRKINRKEAIDKMATTSERRAAVVADLMQFAQECLQRLEEYKQIERDYRDAVRAVKALGVEPETIKKKRGSARANAGRPRKVRNGHPGKGTGYRPPGTTIADQIEPLLRKTTTGLTVDQMAEQLPKGTPRNSIHSGLRTLKERGCKIEGKPTPREGNIGQLKLAYRIKA